MARSGGRRGNSRENHTPRFVSLHHWLLDSPAWLACNPVERALYLEMERRYNGHNNGEIPFSQREAQRRLGCSNKPVMRAFKGLMGKGFIRPMVMGSFDWKRTDGKMGRSTRWLLTAHNPDFPTPSLIATKDFMHQQQPQEPVKGKTRRARSTPLVCLEHTICSEQVC